MRVKAGLTLGLLLVSGPLGCARSGGDSGGVASAGGKPSGAAATDIRDAGLKYSKCMRENGVPAFPDPVIGADGRMTFDAPDDVPDPVMNKAESKCRQHLPFNPARDVDPQHVEKLRKYAQCMRDSGLREFPDPNPDGGSMVNWEKLGVSGPDDPEVKAAHEKCRQLRPSAPAGAGSG